MGVRGLACMIVLILAAVFVAVATIRKPPFSIPVYCVDNDPKKSNLGIRSILYYLPVLILTDLTLGALIFGAIPEWIGLLF